MRVGFVAGEYPPMQGGVGAFTREVGRAMVQAGHQVFVFTRQSVGSDQSDGITIAPSVKGCWGWKTIRLIQNWVRQNRLDILNIQFQTAAFDMHPSIQLLPYQKRDFPTVVTFHDLRVPYLFPKAGKLREWSVRSLARGASGVIATDRADETKLSMDWRIQNVCWIPIGSNVRTLLPNDFSRGEYRLRMGVHEEDFLISYFGFLNQSKGALILVKALDRLIQIGIPAHLIMIGGRSGSSDPTNIAYGERVDAAIFDHNLSQQVHWTGFVDENEVTAAFLSSDVTALPYLDGVSLRRGTLMAALAHGRAIVTTTPASAVPELEGNVRTVRPGDADDLADSLADLWHNRQERYRLEARARKTAEQFTWDSIASRTIAFFEKVMS